MIYLVFIIAFLAQTGVLVFMMIQNEKAKNKLINALMSKTPEDLVNITVAEKMKPEQPFFDDRQTKDLVPPSELSDEDFDKYIVKGGVNGE
jgi:hypothetical protein